MIEHRNLSSHIYDEYEIRDIVDNIQSYKEVFLDLKAELEMALGK